VRIKVLLQETMNSFEYRICMSGVSCRAYLSVAGRIPGDSGWALSRILNLTVNVNKYNYLHAGCYIKLPSEIMMKRAVINVHSMDNACFAWSVVTALHSAERNTKRESSYLYYTIVLNLEDIVFPTVNDS